MSEDLSALSTAELVRRAKALAGEVVLVEHGENKANSDETWQARHTSPRALACELARRLEKVNDVLLIICDITSQQELEADRCPATDS